MHSPSMPSALDGRISTLPCKVVVIWIDWYAYHVARLRGLMSVPSFAGRVRGIELVGGVGVHAGLKFREDLSPDLPIDTLLPGNSWSDAGQLRLSYELWQHLTLLDPDVVLAPGYYTLPSVAAALWARLHRRRSVLMTESTADDHIRVAWKEWLKSLLIRVLFDSAITGGAPHRQYLTQLGFPSTRTGDFYDVVDNSALAARTRTLRAEPARDVGLPQRYFLYVGRLAPEKNVRGLIEAWLAYREDRGTWSLVIVGEGPEGSILRELASQSKFANEIHFAGHKSSRDLPMFYAFAGCFVLPSTREPWGLVVNEAMASSLPVIVSHRCGCALDLVDSENGLTFDPAVPGQLTRCLSTIGSVTSERRASMGEHSAARIARFSPENFGGEVARIAAIETPDQQPIQPGNHVVSLP